MASDKQTFRSAGAVITGGITVAATLALAEFGAFYPDAGWADWLIATMVLIAVVSYVAQIRPAVVLGETAAGAPQHAGVGARAVAGGR